MNTQGQSSLGLPDLPGIGDGWECVDVEARARDGRCTGERLDRIRAMRVTVLESAILGEGVKSIADRLGIAPQVVRAIKASAWASGEVDPLKERMGRRFLALGEALADHAFENIEKIKPDVAVLASAQATDKGLLLTGAPTARIEINHTLMVESVADYIASLPVVTPVRPEESQAEKAAGSSGVYLLPAADHCRLTDSQSVVSSHFTQGESTDRAENGRIEGQKEDVT